MNNTFPDHFIFGTATASYQIEGAVSEGGRGPSVWDTHCHSTQKVQHGHSGDIACDHYHRYEEDLDLIANLGCQAYRFSIAWSRLIPDGDGAINPEGIAFYHRVIDGLLARGIEPWITLFHWDLPQSLEDRYGGWRSRKTAEAFGRYAGIVADEYSTKVRHFFTMNEFDCFTDKCYYRGEFAPAHHVSAKEAFQVRHNALLGHGMAVQSLRRHAKQEILVGLAENPKLTVPVIASNANIEAARTAFRKINERFLSPILDGGYTDDYLAEFSDDTPEFTTADFELISAPLDFIGLNMYTPCIVEADPESQHGFRQIPLSHSHPNMHVGWLKMGPEVAYWASRFMAEIWDVPKIYISENGCSGSDNVVINGQIKDTDRILYLRHYLLWASQAVAEGYPLHGYFLWSLMDNFEWNDGYSERFGLVHVDYATQERTPKLSYDFYSKLIKTRQIH